MQVTLVWNKQMMRERERRFSEAQTYVDNECLKKMTPYVPVALPFWHNAGKLRDSGKIAEPGVIVYTAPHARADYYNLRSPKHNYHHGGNPNATEMWFEYMKTKHRAEIIRGAAQILGGIPE